MWRLQTMANRKNTKESMKWWWYDDDGGGCGDGSGGGYGDDVVQNETNCFHSWEAIPAKVGMGSCVRNC